MAERQNGQCLCGAVRFTAVPKAGMGSCHCSMCRRFTGGVFLVVDCGDSLTFTEGEDSVGWYKSSDWGERGFCKSCGSSLAWRMRDKSLAVVSIQAFDDPGQFAFEGEIYFDDKPRNYEFANKTHRMTGAEFLASMSAKQG